MRNIKLTIEYDGSRYKGWQKLTDTDMTIQAKLEAVLSKMTEENIELIGSGRTDVGVHALNQVANFKTNSTIHVNDIMNYLYNYLPEDIVVTSAEEVDERFHSQYNVKSKKYTYRIWNSKYHDPFLRKYSAHVPEPLNIDKMRRATAYLIGEHDFTSFHSTRSQKKSSIRTIYSITIENKAELIEITCHGNGFLHNMVRVIAGTLIEVGAGRMKPEYLKEILENKDRTLAGSTAPAKGLFLVDVEY